ncbi:MAG: glycine/sarcosine/betaine reductase complex component C subunit beta [bacterium]|nr:glycine/sarcosine/betaine reductase complex component C subunit beta [bacterium]
MTFPVLRGTAYSLIHAPSVLRDHGSTQTVERRLDPDSAYLRDLEKSLRTYEEVLAYPPNQTFIGNLTPEELGEGQKPWLENPISKSPRTGKYGEIWPEAKLFGWMKIVDTFDLVLLTRAFTADVGDALKSHPMVDTEDLERLGEGEEPEAVAALVEEGRAEALRQGGKLVGCVKRAHEFDPNLTAHVILENLVAKASAVMVLRQLFVNAGVEPASVEYLIECSEEACGDMNQRGGGNFAKAIGEFAGCVNATGSDLRNFCAAPVHSVVVAASLVQAGVFSSVAVVGGGSVAKLGMNGKDHVKKGLPVLEDVLGAFAVLVSADDGVSPWIRTDMVGRQTIGLAAAPQKVIEAIVAEPLSRAGLNVADVDKFAPELQNPEVTVPAGAGDVTENNLRLIGALAVMRGELAREDLPAFVARHGFPGYAPTQGHIPSGVPYLGPARDHILAGRLRRVMVIGKGSLFLGRMTNLFDGLSFVVEENGGRPEPEEPRLAKEEVRRMVAEALREVAERLGEGGAL